MFGQGLSTFNPKQLGSLKLWLDAANPSNNGTRPADGSTINTWVDVSGVSNNAVSGGTAASAPTYKLNQLNGLPGIQYGGLHNLQVASLAVGSNFTLFVVSSSSNNSLFIEQSADIGAHEGFYIFGAGGLPGQINNGSAFAMLPASVNWLGTSANLAMIKYDGANIVGWKNGVEVLTAAASISNATVTDTLNIGSRNGAALFTTGYIHEIILLDTNLSAGGIALLNDYGRRKWALY